MKFLVRLKDGYALKFAERFYEIVADNEATHFESREAAHTAALSHGLRYGFYEIESIGPVKARWNRQPATSKKP